MAYTPNRFMKTDIGDQERQKRIGSAMLRKLDWLKVLPLEQRSWMLALAGAHNTKAEYLFFSSLTSLAALAGPNTKVVVTDGLYEEKLNTFMCILGDAGANKSGAYRLAFNSMAHIPNGCMLRGNWTRAGLVAHLLSTEGSCLLVYEEMDSFFASICKGQKNNDGDRALFCELYDGDTQEVVRSTSDFKSQKKLVTEVSMNICGFQQPDPFLLDYLDMCSRKDGFLDRFHFSCPQSSLLHLDEVEAQIDELRKLPEGLRSMKGLYSLVKAVHSQGAPIHYRLSPQAKEHYKEMTEEEIHLFNSHVEQRMAYAEHETEFTENFTMSKLTRSTLKLAGSLHILQHAFERVKGEQECNISQFSTEISAVTFQAARGLSEYFAEQKEILFAKVKVVEERPLAYDRVISKILSSPGKFMSTRVVMNRFEAKTRPSADEVKEKMQTLTTDLLGKFVEGFGFFKNPNADKDKLEHCGVNKDDFELALKLPPKGMSNRQIEKFQEKFDALYPNN